MYKIISLIVVLSAVGCATKEVKLVSDPPAKVFVSSDFSSEFTELGQTPLDIKLKDHAAGNKFAYLAFKAEGHDEQRVVLPSNYAAGSVEIKLNKNEELETIEERIKATFEAQIKVLKDDIVQQRMVHNEEKEEIEESFKGRANDIFRKVIEIQNALHLKKMAKAGKGLAELKGLDAPESLILTLEGNFEFISGKPRRALASYRRALELDPGNVELSGILKELRGVVR